MPVQIMYDGSPIVRKHIGYWEDAVWYGALTFAGVARDSMLLDELRARFEPLFGPKADLIPRDTTLHDPAFAIVPLELYLQTRDTRYLSIGKRIADSQWAAPTTESLASLDANTRQMIEEAVRKGLMPQPRDWMADEAYLMIVPQVQAFRATDDAAYIDRAAREMVAYMDVLQQPNGLFHHAKAAPLFWGRANGWAAAGLAELLRTLPDKHPDRARIMTGYRKMMAALLKYQRGSGLWAQLIDHPEAWTETSCSGMVTFALATGVKYGWLETRTYGPAVRNGWLALTQHINEDGDLSDVGEGTWISRDPQYYLNRDRYVGDPHGQAAVLWSAAAFLR